ncbi:MAG: cell division protein ZapB [Burkholderiales bacterium]|nr:cell division protein ZapB [Burkholderiales bacterium]
MLEQLQALEGRIHQLLERWQAMRAENLRLRQQVVALENDNKLLNERLAEARARLAALYERLPD